MREEAERARAEKRGGTQVGGGQRAARDRKNPAQKICAGLRPGAVPGRIVRGQRATTDGGQRATTEDSSSAPQLRCAAARNQGNVNN